MKRLVLFAGLAVLAPPVAGETVTLPVAASLTGVGGAPFVSDVRVFNTSYTQTLSVTVRYRPAANAPAPQTFSLAPREGRAFDDMVGVLFARPGTLGAVEFEHSGPNESLVAVSQLGSPVATGGKVGMFIPGRRGSGDLVSALVGLGNGASRTNVGIYNPNSSTTTAVVKLYQGVVELGRVTQTVGANQTVQFNVYQAVNQGGFVTTTGHAVVEASDEVFTYAAQADNATNDTILIVGEEDVAQPPGFVFPTPTVSPTSAGPSPTPTPTPTQPASGAIVVNLVASQFEWDFSTAGGQSGSNSFTFQVGQAYELRVRTQDVTHGFSGVPPLGITGSNLSPGDVEIRNFTPTAAQIGTFPFACTVTTCGTGHDDMLGIFRVQN
jgi:heme/copper-type cytochrome/quinol oxidase subunit 2